MIIEYPKCGTKNQTTQPPQPGKVNHCGNCREVITFLETDDTQSTTVGPPHPHIERTDNIITGRTPNRRYSTTNTKSKVNVLTFASGHSRAQWVSLFLAAMVILEIIAV